MHELNFIPLSYRKNVTLPKVTFETFNNQPYGGYYTDNTIVVVENDNTAAVLAHEFRHHLQHYYGCTLKVLSIDYTTDYNTFIRSYFHNSWSEMDALLFENKIAPSKLNKFWLQGLVLPKVLDTELVM